MVFSMIGGYATRFGCYVYLWICGTYFCIESWIDILEIKLNEPYLAKFEALSRVDYDLDRSYQEEILSCYVDQMLNSLLF